MEDMSDYTDQVEDMSDYADQGPLQRSLNAQEAGTSTGRQTVPNSAGTYPCDTRMSQSTAQPSGAMQGGSFPPVHKDTS